MSEVLACQCGAFPCESNVTIYADGVRHTPTKSCVSMEEDYLLGGDDGNAS